MVVSGGSAGGGVGFIIRMDYGWSSGNTPPVSPAQGIMVEVQLAPCMETGGGGGGGATVAGCK